ncbi:hypothetical protein FA132_19885 [Pseudomonas aeruginosa]|nr:hypothetical protein [Pseudomonas aeruginosa]
MEQQAEFKVGQTVEWESQSNGTTSRKRGVVVLDATEASLRLPGKGRVSRNPSRAAKELYPGHRLMFDGIIWPKGRVIVEIPPRQDSCRVS